MLADPLADGFDAGRFAEATLDVDGNCKGSLGEHGIEETLYQLMRHQIQGTLLVSAYTPGQGS